LSLIFLGRVLSVLQAGLMSDVSPVAKKKRYYQNKKSKKAGARTPIMIKILPFCFISFAFITLNFEFFMLLFSIINTFFN